MMDPEAELADFMPHDNTILLLEGPEATPSTCNNTIMLLEGPKATTSTCDNTAVLLEGPKAATSTCDNTGVLRMEGPMADDACAFNSIEVLDISTNSLGEPIQGIRHTQCVWQISGWPAVLAYRVPSELLR